MTYAHQRPTDENFSQAEEAYRKAFWSALKYQQWPSLQTAFFNLGNYLYGVERLSEMRRELDAFIGAAVPADVPGYEYMRSFHQGLCQVLQGNHTAARQAFRKQLRHAPEGQYANIYRFEAYTAMVKSFAFEGRIDSAIHYELLMRRLAIDTHMKDGEALTARDLADFYTQLGDTATASRYNDAALRSKDSLMAVNNLDKVSALNFVGQLLRQEARMQRQQLISRWLVIGLIAVSAIAVLLIVLWWLMWHRRKADTGMDVPQESSPVVKYRSSALGDQEKLTLKEKIRHVLEDDEAVYQPTFCLNQMAELCGSNAKYISQVINELYGCNFTTLIRSLRVKEACRRISDKANYGNLSLEGIAFSVGFKSRVTMYQAFKKEIGMTPTEYQNSL